MTDPNNAVHFPLEFLKSRISSGITPYELKLKNAVSIMLTRNLNSNREPCSEMRVIIIIIIIIHTVQYTQTEKLQQIGQI